MRTPFFFIYLVNIVAVLSIRLPSSEVLTSYSKENHLKVLDDKISMLKSNATTKESWRCDTWDFACWAEHRRRRKTGVLHPHTSAMPEQPHAVGPRCEGKEFLEYENDVATPCLDANLQYDICFPSATATLPIAKIAGTQVSECFPCNLHSVTGLAAAVLGTSDVAAGSFDDYHCTVTQSGQNIIFTMYGTLEYPGSTVCIRQGAPNEQCTTYEALAPTPDPTCSNDDPKNKRVLYLSCPSTVNLDTCDEYAGNGHHWAEIIPTGGLLLGAGATAFCG